MKKIREEFEQINAADIAKLKEFITSEKERVKKEAFDIMMKNGKNEKIAFYQDVIKMAIQARIDIAQEEADCYVTLYDKMKKILQETDSEFIKLAKYQKAQRDASVKLAFLKAEKEYMFGFLDYERMTAINGSKVHKKMMLEACQNFERDIFQIKNLYELILKEIANRANKKAYNELYNKNYLKNIEEKEKNFEEEVNTVNIRTGTVINPNYWRIEGIKNIYQVFQEEVSEKFEKDLSEYRLEELEEEYDEEEEVEYEDEYEDDYEEEYEEEEDEYDEEYEEEEENLEDEYDEEYEEDEYDEEYEEEEYEDEYEEDDYDDEEYDEYEDYEEENELEEEENLEDEYDEEDEESIEDEVIQENGEEDLEEMIQKSRKKGNKKDKGLLGKLFKK